MALRSHQMLEGCGGALEAWDRVAGGLRVSSPSREGDHTPSLSWNSSVLTVTGNCSDRPSGPFSILWWQRLASSELVSHPSAGTQLPEDVQRRVTGASLGSAPGGPSPTPFPFLPGQSPRLAGPASEEAASSLPFCSAAQSRSDLRNREGHTRQTHSLALDHKFLWFYVCVCVCFK